MDRRSGAELSSIGYYAYSLKRAEPSGLTTYVNAMRDVFKQKGVRTRVVACEADPGDPDVLFLAPLRGFGRVSDLLARAWPERFTGIDAHVAVARAALRLDRSERVSLIEFEEHAGLCSLALRLPLRCPIVVRLHGPHFLTGEGREVWDQRSQIRDAQERDVVLRAAAVSAPSADTLNRVRERWQVELPHAVVIPNPAAVVAERDLWTGTGDGPILFVGKFDNRKGFDLVVRAFCAIAERQPGRELWLVGPEHELHDGGRVFRSAEEFLARELPDLALRARVKYLGPRTPQEIVSYRRTCSCVVVASRSETFCIAASEALMSGCPVVCSDATALSEVVEHEKTGLSFRGGDASSLAHALGRLLDEPALARQLAAQGLRTARERYTPEAVAAQTLAFYARTVDAARRGSRAAA